jgi:hypothetical protein
MKRFACGVAALAALAALLAVPAMAQPEDRPINEQIRIKGGFFHPGARETRRVGNLWWALGAEYMFNDPEANRVNSIEVLHTTARDTRTAPLQQDITERYRKYSIAVNHKVRSTSGRMGQENVFFYGGGAGAELVQLDVNDPNPGGEGVLDVRRTFGAANLFVGYEVAANFQIEAKYQFVFGKAAGRNMDGFMLLAGVSF